MIIKLQSDQVVLFWDMVKRGMISSQQIPKEFQQDFALNALGRLLSGMAQCWIGYAIDEEGNKKIHFIFTTSIIDEKYYGIRVIAVDSIYGFRLITQDMVDEIYKGVEDFALANNCNVIAAEYSNKRVKEFLSSQGFEKHRTVCRKFIA